jgi:hypothetical protein
MLHGVCHHCPEQKLLMIVVSGGLFLAFAISMLRVSIQGSNAKTAAASILLTHTQLSFRMLQSVRVKWPPFFESVSGLGCEGAGAVHPIDFPAGPPHLSVPPPRLVVNWIASIVTLNLPEISAPECYAAFPSEGMAYMFRLGLSALLVPAIWLTISLLHCGWNLTGYAKVSPCALCSGPPCALGQIRWQNS